MTANIILDDVSVSFPIYNSSSRSLKKRMISVATGGRIAADAGRKVMIESLSHVNLSFYPGDRVALVGHNGAGKSTLLRVLSGVYVPTFGQVHINGEVTSLLDISVGMDSESTGWENIMLRGILLGHTPEVIREKMDEIAEFSELGEYLDMPMRTYSSGMNLRLAFSIVTAFHTDIILMDEWLSVGDASFNQKASQRLDELVARSSVLVLATHDQELVKRLCNKVVELEHGVVKSVRAL